VLEPLFQGVLVFVSRPHDNHHSSSVRLGITCCTGSGYREIRSLSWGTRTGPRSVHFDGFAGERRETGW
jgi:hypothetical protein